MIFCVAVVAFATLTGAALTLAAEPIPSAITPASTIPIFLFFIAYYHSPKYDFVNNDNHYHSSYDREIRRL
ncbi:hypothetical protein D3C81_2192240 [compost metagenome]